MNVSMKTKLTYDGVDLVDIITMTWLTDDADPTN